MNQMLPRPLFWAEAAAQKKNRAALPGEVLAFLLIYFIAAVAQSLILSIPMSVWILSDKSGELLTGLQAGTSPQELVLRLMEQMPDWISLAALFGTGTMGLAAVIYCRRIQKRSLSSMGLRGKGAVGECLLGLVLGLLLFGAALALGSLSGGFRLASKTPVEGQLGLCLLALLGCLVDGASRELLIRGSFAPSVGFTTRVITALLLSSIVPAMLQSSGTLLSMTGLNNLLLSLLLGIWVIKRGNIWSACSLHAAWIFAGGFLFGFAPAGQHAGVRLLDVDLDLYRPLLSGGIAGPQASICVTVVLLAALGVVLALPAKEPAPLPAAGSDEQAANKL